MEVHGLGKNITEMMVSFSVPLIKEVMKLVGLFTGEVDLDHLTGCLQDLSTVKLLSFPL